MIVSSTTWCGRIVWCLEETHIVACGGDMMEGYGCRRQASDASTRRGRDAVRGADRGFEFRANFDTCLPAQKRNSCVAQGPQAVQAVFLPLVAVDRGYQRDITRYMIDCRDIGGDGTDPSRPFHSDATIFQVYSFTPETTSASRTATLKLSSPGGICFNACRTPRSLKTSSAPPSSASKAMTRWYYEVSQYLYA